MKRRCLSALLVLALMVGLAPVFGGTVRAADAVQERLASAEAIWPDGAVYVDGWDDGCSTCYGFIRELFRHVFSAALPTMWDTSNARFLNDLSSVREIAHAERYTVAQLSAMLVTAQPGDVLIATTGGGSHGVIIRSVAADGSGVYVYDANWNKNSAGEPLVRTNAWWSAEDIQRSRPGAVTIYRYAGLTTPTTGASEAVSVSDAPTAERTSAASLDAPARLSTEKGVYGPADRLSFRWDAVTGATGYRISLLRGGAELFSADLGNSTFFTSAPISPGEYTLVVRAISGAERGREASVSFTVSGETAAAQNDPTIAAEKPGAAEAPPDVSGAGVPEDTVPAITAAMASDASDIIAPSGTSVHFPRASGSYTPGLFSDVAEGTWYASGVAAAYELGLMNGSGKTFEPDGNVTLLQTIIMAARIHSIYTTGTMNFTQVGGGVWYQSYLDYAYKNGLIHFSVYESDVENTPATRAAFADIFAKALPAEALAEINDIADGMIPDVSEGLSFGSGVYLLYRAGVLTGGAEGAFSPASGITRAEAAVIVSRMAESGSRVRFSLD